MNNKLKITISFLMIFGIASALGTNASAATDPNNAPLDWAFDSTSVPLHDEILISYPTVDTNSDGYISQSEAGSWSAATISTINKSLTGTINGIEYFTNVKNFYLNGNQFTGNIPTNIGNLTNAVNLRLHENSLSGSIPSSIGNLSNLKQLYLNSNQLSGEIPSTIGGLSNVTLLYLHNNQLSGEIPTTISGLSSVTHLYLSGNKLTGSIPTSVTGLTTIINLYLYSNQLTGSIPTNIGNLVNLVDLRLHTDQLTGSIPMSVNNLSSLKRIYLDNNKLSGVIDPIANLTTLEIICISNNQFSGTTPTSIGTFPTLKQYDIANNPLLEGDVTNIFSTTPSIQFINVSGTSASQIKPNNASLLVFLYDVLTPNNDNIVDGTTYESLEELKAQLELVKTTIRPSTDPDYYTENSTSAWALNSILSLEKEIAIAQDMLDAKGKVEGLFDSTGDIKDTVTQENINNAQDLVNKLPNGPLKDELQAMIDEAQKQLDAKNALQVPTIKPNTSSTSTQNTISTSDTTNLSMYIGLLSISTIILVLNKKRKIML
ncbi:MAG: toxin Cry1Ac domain D-VI-related protein [Coprobacillaceae bacterium]